VHDAYGWAPAALRPMIDAVVVRTAADPRVVGLLAVGSAATGAMDRYSDLDVVVVGRDDAIDGLRRDAPALAAAVGPLLSAFTGEHVRVPGLLLCLYGPPPTRVDFNIVAIRDLDRRVENGRILWQRDGQIDAAFARAQASWPYLDPQWIEDRFWTWVVNGATKLGRGELFACLEEIAFLRRTVLGPLIVQARGYRPSGVRRIEQHAPEFVPPLQATLGQYSPAGCARSLHAAIALYRRLRADIPGVEHRTVAETAAVTYLEEIESDLAPNGASAAEWRAR
jgi:predicted nucleotidyltransferase